MQQSAGEYMSVFLFGFFFYALLEIAGRGYTHWTMGLLGGVSLMLLYSMERHLPAPRRVRALYGALFITASEFTVGVIDNLIMGWHVWDYSDRAGNLLGQVCPLFSVLWFLLCFPAQRICGLLYRRCHAFRSD
ncbi:MAG: hypothetical protein IJ060_11675 [Oscillospiraceae bacterium]|nr:hypothetical protein [Oscillospiraceae bacterium]